MFGYTDVVRGRLRGGARSWSAGRPDGNNRATRRPGARANGLLPRAAVPIRGCWWLAVAAALGGCSADPSTGVADAERVVPTDVAAPVPDTSDAVWDSSPEVAPLDTTATDVVEPTPDVGPWPCPLSGAPTCVDGGVAQPVAGRPAEAFDGHFVCELVTESPVACDGVCDLGACLPAAPATSFQPAWVQYVWDASISPKPACCEELDGVEGFDNALGDGLDAGSFLNGGSGDIDDTVRRGILHGEFQVALTFEPGPPARMGIVSVVPAALPPALPPPETMALTLASRALVPGTAAPTFRFTPTPAGDGWTGESEGLRLLLPVGRDLRIPILIRHARLDLQPDPDVPGGVMVRLGGVLLLWEIVAALNELFAGDCACWGVTGPLVALDVAAPDRFDPGTIPLAADCPGAQLYCRDIAYVALAGVLTEVLKPDLDTNGDGVADALSMGMTMRTLPAVWAQPDTP